MSGNDAQNERHIHNSNKQDSFESNLEKTEIEGRGQKQPIPNLPDDNALDLDNTEAQLTAVNSPGLGTVFEAIDSEAGKERISLGELKRACPEFEDYALDGLSNWADAKQAAELARPMLGISKDAWFRAQQAMGSIGAIVTVAYLIERAGEIKSAGGYLRTLSDKAEAGKFRLRPMVESLLNR